MVVHKNLVLSTVLALAGLTLPTYADVKLPNIISTNMVLQKSSQTPLWGWADPGEQITLTLNHQSTTVTADQTGKWIAYLDLAKSEKGPFDLTITGKNTLTLKNVLVGEVWLASGQSNMEFALRSAKNSTQEIAAADFPELRQFRAANVTTLKPMDDVAGQWVVCSPKTAGRFTAVGYFFAREIHQKMHTPVGLIHTSWGGTPAEAWTSQQTLAQFPEFKNSIAQLETLQKMTPEQAAEATKKAYDHWIRTAWPEDPGNVGVTKGWAKPDFDDTAWKTLKVPGAVEDYGLPGFDGSIWFRKEITLTEAQTTQDLRIIFGTIDDFDHTYFNGEKIGQTDTDLEHSWQMPREYKIPAKLLKTGKNMLAVRVFDRGGAGGIGIAGSDTTMKIYAGTQPLFSIAGDWKYQIEKQIPTVDLAKAVNARPLTIGDNQNAPVGLYNGMIHPFIPYGIAGVIWYQGEANVGQAYLYRTLFPAMITDWRTHWKQAGGQADFPFYFVQLANFMPKDPQPADSEWAELREAQQMTLSLPNTGTALAIDIGETDNIHPTNKQEVGHRLALNALAKVYGQKLEYSGPVYDSFKIEGAQIRITFTHAAHLHPAKQPVGIRDSVPQPPVTGFAICGPDHKFVWAKATIDGNSVLVSSPEVPTPIAVRYGWANNPDVNLYNEVGLPASPFRTDTFDGLTKPK